MRLGAEFPGSSSRKFLSRLTRRRAWFGHVLFASTGRQPVVYIDYRSAAMSKPSPSSSMSRPSVLDDLSISPPFRRGMLVKSPQSSNRTPHDRRTASNLWVPILTHHLRSALTARSGQFNGNPCRSVPQGCVSTPRIASWDPAPRAPDEVHPPAVRELDRVPIGTAMLYS